jgi:crossover junction endodeoxyribonuclease RusA
VNGQRNMHYRKVAKLVKWWRGRAEVASRGLALVGGPVDVVVHVYLKGKRSQDCGACYPTVKAIIDGIVDAGVLLDDTPEHVASIRMDAPVLGARSDLVMVSLWPTS